MRISSTLLTAIAFGAHSSELANSCFFTYTLKFHWCDPSQEGCDDGHKISAADFQHKLERFYKGIGPPPLEEVYYITALPDHLQESLLEECPAMLILSYMIVAEVKLRLGEIHTSANFWAQANQFLTQREPSAIEVLLESWPIREAQNYYHATVAELRGVYSNRTQTAPPLAIVIAHCREDISWLHGHFSTVVPEGTDLYIYEKCGAMTAPEPFLSVFAGVEIQTVVDGDVRKDECSAYLSYILAHYDSLPQYVMFLQGDAPKHAEMGLLRLAVISAAFGTVGTQFIHLNTQRLVSSQTGCRKAVFEQVFGRPLDQKLSTYCCAQFLVSSTRIRARPAEFYHNMTIIMNNESPLECNDVPGHSTHCLIYEAMWHVVFGASPELPRRVDDNTLPAFLRANELGAESYLPRSSKYLQEAEFLSLKNAMLEFV